ncbi:MAG: DegQ family serine endoprotease [Rhizomicrobium sp.]|jgi:serine protease Do
MTISNVEEGRNASKGLDPMEPTNPQLNRNRKLSAALLSAALLAGGAIVGFAVAHATNTPPPLSIPFAGKQQGFADLVATVRPAVVNIATTQEVKQQQGMQLSEDPQFGEMLRQFLGPNADQFLQQQRQRPVHALGSGFIIDPSGYIVTNNHVIDDATDIDVTLTDGTVHKAHIIGRDTKTDIALLKIDAGRPLPYVAFGNSDRERIGDWVIAVGNPYGLGGSVSAGIISGSKRDIQEGPYDDFLQIDAPINPGNSGGPLFDQSGHVIGIDTAIYSPSGGSVGIGFAIPSDVAQRVVADLRQHGSVARGYLGVAMQTITPALARAMNVPADKGVLVDTVTPGSPAQRGGLRQGDVITAFNGHAIVTPRDMAFAVADVPAGKTVGLTVIRNGRSQSLTVTIGTEHAAQSLASATVAPERERLGLDLAPLSDDQRRQLGVNGGALVENVNPGSPADTSGLQSGDVILRVGQHAVASPADAAAQIRTAEAGKRNALPLLVMRNGQTAFLALELSPGAG